MSTYLLVEEFVNTYLLVEELLSTYLLVEEIVNTYLLVEELLKHLIYLLVEETVNIVEEFVSTLLAEEIVKTFADPTWRPYLLPKEILERRLWISYTFGSARSLLLVRLPFLHHCSGTLLLVRLASIVETFLQHCSGAGIHC